MRSMTAIGDRTHDLVSRRAVDAARFVAPLLCDRVPVRMIILVNAMVPVAE